MNIICSKFLLLSTFILLCLGCNSKQSQKELEIPKIEESSSTTRSTLLDKNDTIEGIQFSVDTVLQNDTLLKVYPSHQVVANFTGKQITFSPENNSELNLVPISGNGLINTINVAYGEHRPLILSPDIIWMTISQGVSTHINQNFPSLEKQLFKANKPKEIRLRNDSLEFGSQHWMNLISSLSDSTKKYTQTDLYAFMAPTYSTTTPVIKTAYEANMLYGFKQAFTYIGEGGCGIPYITLTGSQEDWLRLKERLLGLDRLGLSYWRKELEPLLDQFIGVYNNQVDHGFWKSIYKEHHGYGKFKVSGWIIKLFPYLEVYGDGEYDEESQMMRIEYTFIKNQFLEGDKYLYSNLAVDDFPNYKSEVNITWENYFKNQVTQMVLYSGIMGARQYQDGSLQPWITWAISSELEPKTEPILIQGNKVVHRDPDWIPQVFKSDTTLKVKALYPENQSKGFKESLSLFQKEVNAILTPVDKQEYQTLKFYILANGKPQVITENKSLEEKVQTWVNENRIQWKPAKMPLKDVMFYKLPNDTTSYIPVNSEIEIHLNK